MSEPSRNLARGSEDPTSGRSLPVRVGLWVLEVLPATIVACLVLPWVISGGTAQPWNPATTDLEVYRLAAQDMLAGKDFYATRTPYWGLYFIYPPIALLLMTPLAFGPYVLWQVLWTFGLVVAQQSVLRRVGVPRGWRLALVGALIVVAVEPIRTTLGYGQVNTFLMAFVVAALLPDPPASAPRWLRPRGLLIGLATAIKLTPAYLAVLAFFSRRMAVAWWAFVGFLLFTGLGFALQPSQSLRFWRNDLPAETSGAMYVGNQAISGLVTRWLPMSAWTIVGVVIAAIVAVAGLYAARHWWLRGQAGFAIGLAGLVTCLVSPLSWTHHYVWVLPFGAALALGSALPLWIRAAGGVWALWIAVQTPLAVLPYKNNAAGEYTFGQDLVANLGPLLGALFVLALAVWAVRDRRLVVAPHARGLDLPHGRRNT